MRKLIDFLYLAVFSLFFTLIISQPAMAYVGPGTGLAAIAAFIALTVAVLAALLGFLWFPLKRIMRKRKESNSNNGQTAQEEGKKLVSTVGNQLRKEKDD